jgi:hypothetical protein
VENFKHDAPFREPGVLARVLRWPAWGDSAGFSGEFEDCVMSLSVSSSSSALSYLQSFFQSGSTSGTTSTDPLMGLEQMISGLTGSGASSGGPSAPSGSGATTQPFQSGTLAALLSLQGQGGTGQSSGLLSKLDTDGDGTISKSEFESALGSAGVDTTSADSLFSKLDANGDGSVTGSELRTAKHGGHHAGGAGAAGSSGGGADSLMDQTDATGATTQTTTGPDGSTTTTTTYADGTTMTTTTPPTSQNNGSSNSEAGNNSGGQSNGQASNGQRNSTLLDQWMRLQSQLVTQATSALSALV